MKNSLSYTLLSDGSSDRALIPIITWLLRQHLAKCAINSQFSDLRDLRHPPKGLIERIRCTLDLYPCDVLFVHRDAENESPKNRFNEINRAVEEARKDFQGPVFPTLCVVPVRMMEAWLLFDLNAIRRVAGNPNGRNDIPLPTLNKVEDIPHPEEILLDALRSASGLPARRRKEFRAEERIHRITEFIDDFSPLRCLSAFKVLETDIKGIIASSGWCCGRPCLL